MKHMVAQAPRNRGGGEGGERPRSADGNGKMVVLTPIQVVSLFDYYFRTFAPAYMIPGPNLVRTTGIWHLAEASGPNHVMGSIPQRAQYTHTGQGFADRIEPGKQSWFALLLLLVCMFLFGVRCSSQSREQPLAAHSPKLRSRAPTTACPRTEGPADWA